MHDMEEAAEGEEKISRSTKLNLSLASGFRD
jgi:hypothetical protein